jgi:hypothetical protein
VLGGDDGREPFRFGAVGLVATGAKNAGIGQHGFYRTRIVGVLPLRAVACFAIHIGVPAYFLNVENVGVAGLASFMSGVDDGQSGDLSEGIPAIVAIFSETFRNEPCA